MEFCEENWGPLRSLRETDCGDSEEELPRLQALYERGTANGIRGLEIMGPERIREIEPHARAVRALYSPNTAITDYRMVAEAMAKRSGNGRREHFLSSRVQSMRIRTVCSIWKPRAAVRCYIINCSGLFADRIARMMGLQPDVRLIPFRGEYYSLGPECRLVRA